MPDFFQLYGKKSWEQILSNNTLVSLSSPSLQWVNQPAASFVKYAVQRTPLPFDDIPSDEHVYKKHPTFMIAQVHRLWVTLQVLQTYLQMDEKINLLDLGAYPFSLVVIIREYLKFEGRIKVTVNLPIVDNWKTELNKRNLEVLFANLDAYVTPNIPNLPDYLSCDDDSIDIVVFAHVIEHLYHPMKLFHEIHRVLKPGGKILVSTDNAFMLDSLLNICSLKDFLHEPIEGTSAMAFHAWRGHNRFFTKADITTMLKEVGFEIVESSFFEVYYNSFIEDYFYQPVTHIPKWRAEILTHLPQYRNEIIIVAEKQIMAKTRENQTTLMNSSTTNNQSDENSDLAMVNQTTVENNREETLKAQRAPKLELPAHISMMLAAPAEQLLSERFIIYSLIMGLRPLRCLEIGAHWGGSATIICAAMDDVNQGKLVTVDPNPLIASETLNQISHRVTVIKGFSPDALDEALRRADGLFDFAFIDGDHTYAGVLRDIEGVLPYLAEKAYLLFHDSHYFEIEDAIDYALRQYPDRLFDCGTLSTAEAPENREVNGRPVIWGGLRLVHFSKNLGTEFSQQVDQTILQQLHSTQRELDNTRAALSIIQNSRTWRLSSKISYSSFGRLVSSLFKPFLH